MNPPPLISTRAVRLRHSLDRLHLTPAALARKLGVAGNTAYRYLMDNSAVGRIETPPMVLRIVWLLERHPELMPEMDLYIDPEAWTPPRFTERLRERDELDDAADRATQRIPSPPKRTPPAGET